MLRIYNGIVIVSYGILEEFGWRGYLQDELRKIKPLYKYLIIGILWYSWHLAFISHDTTMLSQLKFLGVLIFASWGIGQIAEKTHSVLASACFHIIGNIFSFFPLLPTSFGISIGYIILGIALSIWIFVVIIWRKSDLHRLHILQLS